MYVIEFAPAALMDLKSLRKFEQQQILSTVEKQLQHEPTVETRNRKQLLPNDVAGWELRIGRFRVFFDPDEEGRIVRITAVGLKVGSLLFLRGESKKL